MLLTDKIRRYLEEKKVINEGKNIHSSNKEIDLLNFDELQKELTYILYENKNVEKLDDRTVDLMSEYFSYGKGEQIGLDIAMQLARVFEFEKVKQQIFQIYSKQKAFPREYLDKFITDRINLLPRPKAVILEEKANRIKIRINMFTEKISKTMKKKRMTNQNQDESNINSVMPMEKNKKNPFQLKISTKEVDKFEKNNRQLNSYIKALIFVNNMDDIDLKRFFDYCDIDTFNQVFEILPEKEKTEFVSMYISSDTFNRLYNDEKTAKISQFKTYISRERLINLCLDNGIEDEKFIQELNITSSELINYCFSHDGNVPYHFLEQTKEAVDELEVSDIEKFFENIKNLDSISSYYLFKNFTKQDFDRVLDNENIDEKVKEQVYRNMILSMSEEEKLELYKNLPGEKQEKLYFTFIGYGTNVKEYNEKLIDYTKNQDLKNGLEIRYLNKKFSLEELVSCINNSKRFSFDISKDLISRLPDEQIIELYDMIDDEHVKSVLLTLNRKINKLFKPKDYSHMTEEEIDRYNENVPNSILLNDKTIGLYLNTAKSVECYATLLYSKEIENMKFDDFLKAYKTYINKRETLIKSSYYKISEIDKKFETCLLKKANLKEAVNILKDGYINKKEFQGYYLENLCYREYSNFEIKNLKSQLEFIEGIDDIEIKKNILHKLNYFLTEATAFVQKERESQIIEKRQNIETLNNIFKEKIFDKEISIENKYLYLSQFIKNQYRNNDSYDEIKELFEKINSEAGKEKYNEIFNFTPKYIESTLWKENVISNNYMNYAQCMPYLASDKVYSLMIDLYERNNSISETISEKFLNPDLIDKVDYNIIEYLSRYSKNMEISNDRLEIFISVYEKLKVIKSYPEEYVTTLTRVIESVSDEELSKINFEDENNIDLLTFFAIHQNAAKELNYTRGNSDKNIFELYKEKIKDSARKEIHSSLINRRSALNAIGKRFFYYSYEEMCDLKDKYNADYKIYLNKLINKSQTEELSLEEDNQLKALITFRNIDELMKIKDIDALVRVFDELDNDEEYKDCDFLALSALDEQMKRIYSKDLIEKAYEPLNEDKVDSIDGIEIYSPKKFNIFVHVVAAYGDYKLIDDNISAKEIWNAPDNKENHLLCTSYIGNNHMCYVRREENDEKNEKEETVILGFGQRTNSEITMASQSDIGSNTTTMSSEESYRLSRYRTAENIIKYCRHGHNEIDFERRKKDDKEKNIEPEYVICFDEINDTSKKVARDFNIPILLINKQEIAKQQSEELKNMINNFKRSKDPKILEELVNLYQCSKSSFCIGEKDREISDKMFNPENMNEELENILSILKKEMSIGNRENVETCYLTLYNALNYEMEICKEKFRDVDEFSDFKTHLREVRHKLKEIIEKNNINTKTTKINDDKEIGDKMYQTIISERNQELDEK